ncbi:hypothetical protein JXB31_01120 [Candidatus Woesearchaeota archaeon]|nr:hypothetical protein [Candidatus Woesearchaeota archaeon]
MPKKCIICGAEAKYCIKHTSEYYCEDCAAEHFGDISLLVKVEDQARKLKKMIEDADFDLDKLNSDMGKAEKESQDSQGSKDS